ncbi:MAG: Cna B-type domain-containing protein [Tyzzerella sp.]|nr:Cna B-type domain-containing protein [Tyzzerella sp.]
MNKFKGFKLGKGKADVRKIGAALVATMLVVAMVIGLLPNDAAQVLAADKTTNIEGFSATMIADPDTSEDNHIFNGTPAEDGKIWTDKSVTTGAIYGVTSKENNFYVALSAMAQTYNTVETGMSTEQKNIAYDVVFVLDFSGSMNDSSGGTRKALSMVNALNPAIVTLMENAQSRIAVVGYAGSDVSTSSATTLLSLDHYNTTSTNDNNEKIYFQYSNNTISTVSGVTNSNNQTQTVSKQVNGGTPTQRGIYRGMDILQQAASNATDADKVTRVPIIVLLTDGAAGSARSNYTTLSGGTFYEGDANNGDDDAEVGAYTVLTANYAKDTVAAAYKAVYDYSGISNASIAKFYTIGLGITENSWTHFMLNPGASITATGNNKTIIDDMKTILTKDTTYGSDYAYSDYYKGGSMTEEELKTVFQNIVDSLQVTPQVTSTVNDPVATELSGSATGTVKFTDYLGYKMELKGDHQYLRYGGVNYRFDKQNDGFYKFSGYDQAGNAVTGPVITKNDITYTLANVTFKAEWTEEEYNDQNGYWKITWEFPSALLPTYSRLNDYDNTDLDPIRMLYEVGLTEDVDLQKDSLKITEAGKLASDSDVVAQYVFHTNLYDYTNSKAMTWSEYTPAADNPFYYETGYTTDSSIAGTETPYIRLDMTIGGTQQETKQATADVQLNNISLNLSDAKATFYYDGVQYTVDLSGDETDGAIWSGEVSIPVRGYTADGQEVSVNVAARIEATYVDVRRNDYLDLSKVTIKGTEATISGDRNNGWSADLENFVVGTVSGDTGDAQEEIVSVYMELKGNETDGYYVEDANGNKIAVTKDGNNYKVVLGDTTYYSSVYYKYADGTTSYVEKDLAKGTIARSLVGQFKIDQSKGTMTADNFADIFTYYASNGAEYPATRITYPDGTYWGEEADPNAVLPPKGTFKVCVDDIWNGLTDVNGDKMIIHFDFIIEEQTLEGGGTRYVVLDCSYYEAPSADGNTYAVDVVVSDTPEIDEEKNYLYDVSYTIESTHASGAANVTQTDPHFFHSHFTSGHMQVLLGNNGRVAVDINTAYEKAITAEKEWYDRLGNKLDVTSDALKDVSVTVGLYQQYSYTGKDADNNEVEYSQEGTNGVPFATVVLNQANNFTYTWETPTLPKYLVDDNGDYRLDKNNSKVEVTYVVDEVEGATGWTLSTIVNNSTDDKDIFTLHNVPLTEFSPSVQKVWTDGAPDGYKVKMELLANGVPVTEEKKLDAEHIIVAELKQENADGNAELKVTFGGDSNVENSPQTVLIKDFGGDQTVSKDYTFIYRGEDGNGFGGEAGTGTHAEYATVKITVSNTGGAKLSIANATVSYHYTDLTTKEPAEAILETYRTKSEETDTTKTSTFLMYFTTQEKAEVILDGVVDTEETKAWYNKLDKWNLPMLDADKKVITYSVRETLLVPFEESMNIGERQTETIDGVDYVLCLVKNGLIIVPQADGSEKVFKSTITNTEDYQFTVTNDEAVTSITAEKVWVDNNNAYGTRPDKITFKLKADGNVVGGKDIVVEPGTGIWNGTAKAEWTDLPVYDTETGEEITYTVEEVMGTLPTSDEYEVKVEADPDNAQNFIVTNSLYASTSMEVEKVWIDNNNNYGTRPDNIYMVLYRRVDGTDVEEIVPDAVVITLTSNGLEGKWENLAKYNEKGKKYFYSVKEYESLTARNVEGVSGYKDVSAVGDKTETSYKFTNQLDDGAISKTVTKEWKDKALESTRPTNVTVVLSGTITVGGEEKAVDLTAYNPTQILTSPWSYTWENLPEYSGGYKIDYTITETKVGNTGVADNKAGNYVVSVQDDGVGNDFVVTNTLTGETTVTVKKEWKDTPEGFVIPTVTFDIYNRYGGKQDATLTVTEDNPEDSATLPKYNADGDTIYYTVVEQPILDGTNYKIDSVVGSNEGTDGNFYYNAVNTYVQLVQDISGTKTWVGVTGENIPEAITIKLYRQAGDGEKVEVTDVTPTWKNTDSTIWTYTYTGLPIYENDDTTKPYTYSVEETGIDGTAVADTDYTATKDGDLNIINTLGGTVDGVNLKGTKQWYGVTSGNVPDSIQVQLMRSVSGGALEAAVDTDGKSVGITVSKSSQSEEMSWNYDFSGVTLPKYDANGNEYTYSVKEISVTAGSTTRPVVYPVVSPTSGTVGDYTVALNGMNITNTLKGGTAKDLTVTFPMIKEWITTEGYSIPNSITVKLTGSGVAQITETKQLTSTTEGVTIEGNVWKYTFKNLRKYTDNGITEYVYSIEETYVGDTAVQNGVAGEWHVSMPDKDLIINSHDVDLVNITVNKKWAGVTGNNIPDSIQIQLYQNGVKFGVPTTLTKTACATDDETTWSYTFTGLPKSSDGTVENQYVYTVKELSVTAGADTETVDEQNNTVGDYTVSYSADSLTITNTLNAGDNKVKTTYPVTKNWINADGQIPDSITIQLMQSGVDAKSKDLTNANAVSGNDAQWQYTFTGLRKYTDNGISKYVYTAKETKIETINVETKDGQLKAGDFFVTYTQQNKDATIINNRLATVNVDKELIDYPVEKVWLDKDGNPLTENLPETITVQLYQDDAAYGAPYTFTTDDIANNWKHVFTDLRKYQDDGLTEYEYSVQEIKIDDTEVVGDEAGAFAVTYADGKITNKLTGATTKDVTITKEWVDVTGENIPDSIQIQLYQNGKKFDDPTTLTKPTTGDATTWTYTFEDMPIYTDGVKEIEYTVKEISVTAGDTTANVVYTDSTNGTVGDYIVKLNGLNITNTLKQGDDKDLTVEYPVIKKWDVPTGATLPASITVQLYRDNAAYKDPYTFTAEDIANNWKHVFTNLRKYTDNGISEYQYSVKETKVDNYEVTDGKVGAYTVTVDGNVITNKLSDNSTDLLTEITVTKEWENVNTNNMPSAIKVHLYRDGEPYGIVTQISGTGTTWTHTFKHLPKYSDGVTPSVYTVKELSIHAGEDSETVVYTTDTKGTAGDYDVTLDQDKLTIKNTLKQDDDKDKTVDIPFTKLWRKADGTAMTENLPTEITVQLLRDGTAMAGEAYTKQLTIAGKDASDASKWTGEFTGLRKYSDNGITKYKYTVTETAIKMVVDGKPETVSVSNNKAGSYEVSINDAGNVITNQLSQDPNVTKTSATITKTWVGVTGTNIPSIKVQLLQDGENYGEPVVLKADTEGLTVVNGVWNYTFNDLPVYQSNGIIRHVYTVAEVEIDGVKVENGKAGDYESNVNGLAITNELTGTVDKIEGQKIWKDAAKVSERPAEIMVVLRRTIDGKNFEDVETKVVEGTKDKAEWSFKFDNDEEGYPKYDSNGNEYTYSVKEQGEVDGDITLGTNDYKVAYGKADTVYTITNTLYGEYDPKDNPIKVNKVWLDDDNSQKKRPDSISMTLVQNGDLETIELTAQNQVSQEKKNEWSGAFTKTYPMYDAEGALISYSVKENPLADYTLKETKGTAAEGFTLTNVYAPGKTTITVNKVWVDNSNALKTRPETLTLNLLQNGNAFGTIELKASEGNTWTATKEVPSTDENGKLYTYTVEEPKEALKGTDYVKTAEEGLTVTNTLQAEVHVQGTKTWKNIDKEYRPESITVELWRKTAEGTEVQMTDVDGKVISITTNEEKEWKYDFGNFAKYDENGALYTYIVKETKIGNTPVEQSDYTVSNGEGYDLINKLKDVKIIISGKKTWVDNNDQYKMRPESITVNLLRDGVKVTSVQVKAAADGTWTYEFKDLPKYNMDNGKLYAYSVEEAAVENYKSSVNGYDITNTLDETKIPTPEEPTTPSAPKTSDSRTAAGYALTTIIALAAVATAFFKRKRIVK